MLAPLTTSLAPRRAHLLSLAIAVFILGVQSSCSSSTAPPPDLSPLEQQGFALFSIHCASCHSTAPETIIVGPSLEGVATAAAGRVPGQDAETYLRTSILDPYSYLVEGYSETMPPDLGKRLTGEEFDAIMAYLLTLR